MFVDDVVRLYCICDDVLKSMGHIDDPQCRMSTAEVMVVGLVAARYSKGNYRLARQLLMAANVFSSMLSPSQLCYRLRRIGHDVWQYIFQVSTLQLTQGSGEYAVDSMPIPICHPARSFRSKILTGKEYLGYCASKQMHYLGFKLHLICDCTGRVVEYDLQPASMADITALRRLDIDLPKGAVLYADRAYTHYEFEEALATTQQVHLVSQRKSNHKRQHSGPLRYLQSVSRKRIETVFSQISELLPRHLHISDQKGFFLKMTLFLLVYSLQTGS